MPLYKYRAKKGPENIIEASIEAQSKEEAIEKVSQLGLVPVRIEEGAIKGQLKETSAPPFLGGIKARDITTFSRQLASFMKSGMPILRALSIISEQTENRYLKNVFGNIRAEVRDGKSLSVALSSYPRIFSPLYIAMVRSGEDSGTLQEVFFRIADYRQKQQETVSRVRMALVYPTLMVFVAVATIFFMFTFVMPRLVRIFSRLGEDLPRVTKILIAISDWMRLSWPWMLLGIVLVFFIVRKELGTKRGKLALSRLKLSLPVFGQFSCRAELAKFSHTLELLIKNGIPILKAIGLAIPTLDNEVIKQQLVRSYKELEQGESFGESLKDSPFFPKFMSNLLIMGEESGALEAALAEIADAYEKETEEAVKVMTTLLEPIIILVMGLVVGFIVIAMLLPVFQINLMVK